VLQAVSSSGHQQGGGGAGGGGHGRSVSDLVALLDSRTADDVMATLTLAADTASRHHRLMTFDPAEPRPLDLVPPAVDPKRSRF